MDVRERPKAVRHRNLRMLAACGAAAPILFATVVAVLGAITLGYSHVSQPISALGAANAPYALFQNPNFIATGLLIVVFAFGLHGIIGNGRESRVGPALIAGFGIIAPVFSAVFQCDPGCRPVSLPGTLHIVFGVSGFFAGIFGILILSKRLGSDPRWTSYRSYSIVTGLLALLFLLLFMWGSATASPLRGLFQRLFIAPVFLWMGVMAVKALTLLKGRPEEMVEQDSRPQSVPRVAILSLFVSADWLGLLKNDL